MFWYLDALVFGGFGLWMLWSLEVLVLDVMYFGRLCFGCFGLWMFWSLDALVAPYAADFGCILDVLVFGCFGLWMLCTLDDLYLGRFCLWMLWFWMVWYGPP